MRVIVSLLLLFVLVCPTHADYLYKTTLLRAAPGKLLQLIDVLEMRMEVYERAGVPKPFWMRHSQGDQWDLLVLLPIESYQKYYSLQSTEKLEQAAMKSGLSEEAFHDKLNELVARDEDVFVWGPSLEEASSIFAGAGFFHVEMFISLPGKQTELIKQRKMENIYLKNIERPQNLIFVRDQGAVWDVFTIGCYRDIRHFAESADVPEEKEEKAAKIAGFEAANRIGTYLRTLMSEHHDTLAVAIK
ncbi:MAG: hypothetical protein ACE5IR_04470 [bacterium]